MKRNQLIIAAVVIAVLLIGGIFFLSTRSSSKTDTSNESELETIPTVDASVKVNLERTKPYAVKLTVKGLPAGTKEIYYELSYETKEQGLQGTFTTEPLKVKPGQSSFEKDIELRTCSAGGACTNHDVVGAVSVQIKFSGDYGERLFEGEFKI